MADHLSTLLILYQYNAKWLKTCSDGSFHNCITLLSAIPFSLNVHCTGHCINWTLRLNEEPWFYLFKWCPSVTFVCGRHSVSSRIILGVKVVLIFNWVWRGSSLVLTGGNADPLKHPFLSKRLIWHVINDHKKSDWTERHKLYLWICKKHQCYK